jgi:hypothetical protein
MKDEKTKASVEELLDAEEPKAEYTIRFKEPFEYEGNVFDKLEFDFFKLTGSDFINIYREISRTGYVPFSARFDPDFCAIMAAKACRQGIDVEYIKKLPINKFEQLFNACRNFFNERG